MDDDGDRKFPVQIDLKPHEYRERQPILMKGWWVGVLAFVFMIAFATFVMRPLYLAYSDAFDGVWYGLFPRK